MRDPKLEPWPGDVLAHFSVWATTRHVVEAVSIPGGMNHRAERRVQFEGQLPVSMRSYRRWAGDSAVSVELVAQLQWTETPTGSPVSYISSTLGGVEYGLEFYDSEALGIGYMPLVRLAGGEHWKQVDGGHLQASPCRGFMHIEGILRRREEAERDANGFDVEAAAKAIAANLLRADLHLEDVYPEHADELRLGLRRLAETLSTEAGEYGKRVLEFRLRPTDHHRAELVAGDPILMADDR
jgi:hypothetical protein